MFEASVAGGTPIIGPLLRDLVSNEISSIHAIINGTTNYNPHPDGAAGRGLR